MGFLGRRPGVELRLCPLLQCSQPFSFLLVRWLSHPSSEPSTGLSAQQMFIRPCLSPHIPFPRPRVRPESVPIFPVLEGGAHGFASGCFGERWWFSGQKPLNQSLGLRLSVPLLPPAGSRETPWRGWSGLWTGRAPRRPLQDLWFLPAYSGQPGWFLGFCLFPGALNTCFQAMK